MLDETVFRSDDVPAADRLAYWAEQVGQTHAPVRMSSDHADDFRAVQRVLGLGSVSVWPATFQQLVIRRTPRLIRRSDPEVYHLSLVVAGTGVGDWDDQAAVYRPSDLHLNDSAVPWEIRTGQDPVTAIGVEVPKALLPLPHGMTGRRIPRYISSSSGIGALLAQFLTQLTADTSPYQPCDGARLGTVLTDLVAALFAHSIEAESSLPEETSRRALVLQIKNFIQARLHDPQLTPALVAAAHHISTSYLHRLFAGEEETVAVWIRHRRLEAARRDLRAPELSSVPIHAIATSRGFPRASDFTRAFRSAYGYTPKDYRHHAPMPGESTER